MGEPETWDASIHPPPAHSVALEKRHAEMVLEAFKSHDYANDYFGLDGEESRTMAEMCRMIFAKWPELKEDGYGCEEYYSGPR